MPAKSQAQQKAAGAALAAKRGDQKVSDLKGPAKSMYKSMSESELDEMASTKRKSKPQHASKKK
jgi:Zn/Cd-binding protein ZinT